VELGNSQQVGDVSFGVDEQGGHLVQGSLFEQSDAEPGLATAGHPNTDGMRHQIVCCRSGGGLGSPTISQVVDRPQIERAELFRWCLHHGGASLGRLSDEGLRDKTENRPAGWPEKSASMLPQSSTSSAARASSSSRRWAAGCGVCAAGLATPTALPAALPGGLAGSSPAPAAQRVEDGAQLPSHDQTGRCAAAASAACFWRSSQRVLRPT
jgi:hypothetical protein